MGTNQKTPLGAIIPIANVNNVELQLIVDGKKKFVPIKPLCDALGISVSRQIKKIKEDEILGSVMALRATTGSDGKTYEMSCLPLEFVFGWLFTINPNNVSPEAKQSVINYKLECYNALFNYFISRVDFLEDKKARVEHYTNQRKIMRRNFANAKNELANSEKKLDQAVYFTYDEWKYEQATLLNFEEEEDKA